MYTITILPSIDTSIINKLEEKLNTICTTSKQCATDINHLDLSDNKLGSFPTDLTRNWFKALTSLNFSHNQLQGFDEPGFSSFKLQVKLNTLDLSFNQLAKIESDSFAGLELIEELHLSHNQIDSVDPFAFSEHSRHLVELDLSHNAIRDNSVEFLLFANLPSLRVLNLDNNQLTMFSSQLILNFNSLERLSVKENQLKTFDIFQLGQNNKFLKAIDISFNVHLRFENIKGKIDKSNENQQEVEFLSYQSFLTNTKKKGDSKAADDVMSRPKNNILDLNLAGIDLDSPNTNSFLDKVFSTYNGLKYLNMSWTNIRSIKSFEWPQSIESIDLSYNRIESFDCAQFAGGAASYMHLNNRETNRLRNIYLNNNQLSNFAEFIESCSAVLNKPYMVRIF